jgi:transposase InsO family protein
MDILGPLTTTDRDNRFLLVITDRYSKLNRAFPLSTTTADVVAHVFFDGWVASGYGIPSILPTDNGPQFCAKFFQTFCKTLGVKQVFTSAYRPSKMGRQNDLTVRWRSTWVHMWPSINVTGIN